MLAFLANTGIGKTKNAKLSDREYKKRWRRAEQRCSPLLSILGFIRENSSLLFTIDAMVYPDPSPVFFKSHALKEISRPFNMLMRPTHDRSMITLSA